MLNIAVMFDMISVTCDIEITRFEVREKDNLAGTETITIQ